MATSYDAAVETLYRGALDAFVAERKRLASELKAGGDKEGAARLAKLGRPSISAWVVNQLWWNERQAFERLLAAAARVKKGDHDASEAHRNALSGLRTLAAARLANAGHAAAEATLRRVTTTLSALAAAGGFEPDPAGALVADREPPGFEAHDIGLAAFEPSPKPERGRQPEDAKSRQQAEEERKRAEAERRRHEEELARKHAERQRLLTALGAAQADAATHQRDVDRLRREIDDAEHALSKARSTIAELKRALAALE